MSRAPCAACKYVGQECTYEYENSERPSEEWLAKAVIADPIFGCAKLHYNLQKQVKALREQLDMVRALNKHVQILDSSISNYTSNGSSSGHSFKMEQLDIVTALQKQLEILQSSVSNTQSAMLPIGIGSSSFDPFNMGAKLDNLTALHKEVANLESSIRNTQSPTLPITSSSGSPFNMASIRSHMPLLIPQPPLRLSNGDSNESGN